MATEPTPTFLSRGERHLAAAAAVFLLRGGR